MATPPREQLVEVPGGRVWTATFPGPPRTPLLVLHGGPGMPSRYLSALSELAVDRPVVLYDQLGCGRSARPSDPSLWTVSRYVAEVEAVRHALGLGRLHVLGHSWGGFLALSYVGRHADRVASLVLSSPLVSVPGWVEDAEELVASMPVAVRRTIERLEARQAFDDPAYLAATDEFYRRFFCHLDPWPEELQSTFREMGQEPYRAMWGPSEFTQTGNLRGADLSSVLPGLTVPSLWTCGTHDEVSPERLRGFARAASGRARVFEGGSHCLHLEQTDAYLAAVKGFLAEADLPLGGQSQAGDSRCP